MVIFFRVKLPITRLSHTAVVYVALCYWGRGVNFFPKGGDPPTKFPSFLSKSCLIPIQLKSRKWKPYFYAKNA